MDRTRKIGLAQAILGYEFQNEDLLWEALQAPGSSVAILNGRVLAQGNKSLAALGDAVATLVLKLDCYARNRSIGTSRPSYELPHICNHILTEGKTGETATILQGAVNNSRFASLCDKTGLTACVNSNPSQGGLVSRRTRADTLEAVIGAVYQDGGIDSARAAMQSLQVIEGGEFW